jgi:hypothetical protein
MFELGTAFSVDKIVLSPDNARLIRFGSMVQCQEISWLVAAIKLATLILFPITD